MLIRSAKAAYRSGSSVQDMTLRDAGIRDCRRKIIIFIDKKNYDNERVGIVDPLKSRIGLAFQINLSITDGRQSLTNIAFGSKSNSSVIRMNVYSYDVLFENNYSDFESAFLTIRSAYGSEIFRNYESSDYPERTSDIIIYNRLYQDSPSMNLMYDSFFSSSAYLVPPLYYTAEHMYEDYNHEFFTLFEDSSIFSSSLKSMVDTHTEISFLDMSQYDSIAQSIQGFYQDITKDEPGLIGEKMTSNLFDSVAPSMITDAVFIYDSESGSNIKGGTVPFMNFRDKRSMAGELQSLKDFIIATCKTVEDEHGSIRAFYSPSLCGDRIRIIGKEDPSISMVKSMHIDRDYTSANSLSGLLSNFNDD